MLSSNCRLLKDKVLSSDNFILPIYEEAKQLCQIWVLGIYHIMLVRMIVFYIEVNTQTKRYVINEGMTCTGCKIKGKHLEFLIIY